MIELTYISSGLQFTILHICSKKTWAAENQQKTGDSAKAKQSLNQAFIVCAGIPEEAVKVQLQNMIREKLNDL